MLRKKRIKFCNDWYKLIVFDYYKYRTKCNQVKCKHAESSFLGVFVSSSCPECSKCMRLRYSYYHDFDYVPV